MVTRENLGTRPRALRERASAGEPLNPEVIEQVEKAWGLVIRDGYGQTETTALIGNSPGQIVKPGSMGRPLPGFQIAVVDLQDKECPEGASDVGDATIVKIPGEVRTPARASWIGLLRSATTALVGEVGLGKGDYRKQSDCERGQKGL